MQSPTRTTALHIHINRLTLEGRSAAEGRRIVTAMERHLTDLANSGPARLAAENATIERMDTGTIAHGANANAIGRHVATHVFGKLGGPRNG